MGGIYCPIINITPLLYLSNFNTRAKGDFQGGGWTARIHLEFLKSVLHSTVGHIYHHYKPSPRHSMPHLGCPIGVYLEIYLRKPKPPSNEQNPL